MTSSPPGSMLDWIGSCAELPGPGHTRGGLWQAFAPLKLPAMRFRTSCTVSALVLTASVCVLAAPPVAVGSDKPAQIVDFRYAPNWWQTCIGLTDDWCKTLVTKEGALLYDFPGSQDGMRTRILAGISEPATWVKQELVSPRVPIVRTISRTGDVEITAEAFAVTPEGNKPVAARSGLQVQRLDFASDNLDFAKPTQPCQAAFRSVAVHWSGRIHYCFAQPESALASGSKYTVALGFCEGYWKKPAQRVMDIRINGKLVRTIDPAKDHGQNVPFVLTFDAADEDHDGWIDVEVSAAAGAPDQNAILSAMWIYPAGQCPPADELVTSTPTKVPPLVFVDCGAEPIAGSPREDLVILHLKNTGKTPVAVNPLVRVETQYPVDAKAADRVRVGMLTDVLTSPAPPRIETAASGTVMHLPAVALAPGAEQRVAVTVARGAQKAAAIDIEDALSRRAAAEKYWRNLPLPYDRFSVPDTGVQAVLDSSIRNIYQAREIKRGLPAFQVGPTCYRGLWVVDGSFLMEAVAFLGRTDEARSGIGYLMSFQRDDGSVMIIDGHLKETGIALWALSRHARLTGDRRWLAGMWPKVEAAVHWIHATRERASTDPKALEYGLFPPGFTDGGIGGINPEYSNTYWTLIGLRAAVESAYWLGRSAEADEWQRAYDSFMAAFRQAARRDVRVDSKGNRYLPIVMGAGANSFTPQRGQWAFLHAVYPGQLFAADDPLVQGNMAMLKSVECEGLVLDTGWLKYGLWNYFGSFYAHAWLWLGDGSKAADTLYAFANHASPLMAWREEHRPRGEDPSGRLTVGDMPHNWASAEFVRLVRHLLVLERGNELHLLEGLPAAWVRPGMVTRANKIPTDFGPMSVELAVAADGRRAKFRLTTPKRTPPARIVLHLDSWSGRKGSIELPVSGTIRRTLDIVHATK